VRFFLSKRALRRRTEQTRRKRLLLNVLNSHREDIPFPFMVHRQSSAPLRSVNMRTRTCRMQMEDIKDIQMHAFPGVAGVLQFLTILREIGHGCVPRWQS
jgi:hypothetical protein